MPHCPRPKGWAVWTVRCTIARGRKVEDNCASSCPRHREAVSSSISTNSHKYPANAENASISPRTASLIGTRNWYTHLAWCSFNIILVTLDIINQAIDKTVARYFHILFKWVTSWLWYCWFCWQIDDVIYMMLRVCCSGMCQWIHVPNVGEICQLRETFSRS